MRYGGGSIDGGSDGSDSTARAQQYYADDVPDTAAPAPIAAAAALRNCITTRSHGRHGRHGAGMIPMMTTTAAVMDVGVAGCR
jgi:hypothetical protein